MGGKQSYAYMKRWRYERAHGLTRTTPIEPVSAHVHELLDAGWSLRSIADAAGCDPAVVLRLKKRDQTRIRKDIAERVLAVTDDKLLARSNAEGFVRNLGARRRIQALLTVGWRHQDISAAMLTSDAAVGTRSPAVLHQRGEWIARRSHDAVCAAYDRLAMTPGPSDKTRRLAAKYGYTPPLAWDEDTIDNPAALPNTGGETADPAGDGWDELDAERAAAEFGADALDEIAVERIMAGTFRVPLNSRAPELPEAVRRLAARGLNDAEIGERIGRTRTNVTAIRLRNNIASPLAGRPARLIDGIGVRPGESEAADQAPPESQPAE